MFNDAEFFNRTKEEIRDGDIAALCNCALRIEKKLDVLIDLLSKPSQKNNDFYSESINLKSFYEHR